MFKTLLSSPTVAFQLLLSSLVINILGLTGAIFSMMVFRRYLSHGIDSTLITLTSGALFAIIFDYILRRVRFRTVCVICVKKWRELGDQIFSKLLSGEAEILLRNNNTANRGSLDRLFAQLSGGIVPPILLGLLDIPFALIFLAVLFLLAWQLAAVTLIIMIIVIALMLIRMGPYARYSENLQEANMAQSAVINSAEHFETVRLINAGSFLHKRWHNRSGDSRVEKYLFENLTDKTSTQSMVIVILTTIITIALGSKLVLAGKLDVAGMITANILAAKSVSMLIRPLQALPTISRASTAFQRINVFLSVPEQIKGSARLNNYEGYLELEDISFGFPGGKGPLFEHLNVKLKPGAVLVVKGRNGSGKTTLARLLSGLYNPRRGSILVGGSDLRQLDAEWWKTQLIYVPQDPEFISATLRNNFRFLTPDISDNGIMELLTSVGLESFVRGSNDGLGMMLSNGGGSLSPGIKRKLAVARALATDGSIVLLDEPMTALDDEGIAAIQKIISSLISKGKTIILFSSSDQVPPFATLVIDLNEKPTPMIMSVKGNIRG